MEIYGSLVLLARHCPNIEDRCFSRQVWRRGRAFEVALTVSVRAPARGPRPLAPPLRSGHPVKGAHPLHNPRSNPTPCIVVVAKATPFHGYGNIWLVGTTGAPLPKHGGPMFLAPSLAEWAGR